MKKVFIILLIILLGTALVIIPNIKGSTDNSFTIEYQNNKNLALPNLTGKTEISGGLYRLYNNNGFTIDYNKNNGNYIYNGTGQAINILLGYFEVQEQSDYIMKLYHVSGNVSDISRPRISFTSTSEYIRGTYADTLISNLNVSQQTFNTQPGTALYENYTIKLQIEKGSQATSYVVPKSIPVYKDNLTYKEKQKIGIGAFSGITNIIKTINNIVQPITNMFNSIIDFFN